MKFIKRLLGLFSRKPKSMQDYMAAVERHLRRVSKEAKKNPLPPSSDSVLRRKHQAALAEILLEKLATAGNPFKGNLSLSQRQAFQVLQKELPFPEAHVCDEALLAIIDDEEQLNRYAASTEEDIPVVEVRKDELPVEKIVNAWDGDQDELAPLDTSEVVVDKVVSSEDFISAAIDQCEKDCDAAIIETHISADPVCNYLMRYTNVMLGKSFDYVNAPLPGMSEETFATLQATSMQTLPEVVRTLPLADMVPEVADAVRAERVRLVGVMYDSLTMMRK